jgi:tricorn protease
MKIGIRMFAVAVGVCVGLLAVAQAMAAPGYYRYPDIHENQVVFCAEADLWLTSDQGGSSRRLTTHPGSEYFPNFSPDGKWIAFTGEYDGNRDVFVIETAGGEPRRLTWHPARDEVLGWTPDGKKVLFRSGRENPHGSFEIFTVPATGGDPEKLPLGWAARLDIDPRSGRWAFNRLQRETRTWKRYRGGTAPDVWVGDPDRQDYRRVADSDANDTFPMWHDGRVYFLSDRGGTANLWSVLPEGDDLQQHTRFDEWDARWPAMGPDGRIAFSLAADIHIFDPESGRVAELDVELPSDRTLTRVRYPNAAQNLSWFDLSPEGDRLAVVTRGEIFSVPVKEGVTLPITRGSGARERRASFDPEGKKVVYISDSSGEEAIHTRDSWGRGEEEVVKAAGDPAWNFTPRYSPDGKWIAYGDNTHSLYIVPAEGGSPKQVAESENAFINQYVWSPDGRWLAYTDNNSQFFGSIYLYDTKEEETHAVTGHTTDDRSPAWDPEGRYLYFLSNRATNPILGGLDWDNVEAKNSRLYMVLLREDVKNPFANLAGLPPEDEKEEDEEKNGEEGEEKGEGDDKEGEKGDEKKKEELEPVEIDLEGLAGRVIELPTPRGIYFGLEATAKGVFYMSAPLQGFAEMPGLFQPGGPINTLMAFDLEKKEPAPFVEGVLGFDVADKGEKIAILKGPGEVYVVGTAAPPGAALGESKVSLDGMIVELDPREEWSQIFYEAWRNMREFYWDANMGGLDWKKERDRYATLLPRLSTRADLGDLLGELIGELSTSHTYVFGGDSGVQVPRVPTGLLGAKLIRHGDAYKVEKIYRPDPADNAVSPLAAPGVNVKEGEYILAINNLPFAADQPVYASLANMAGKDVTLTVNGEPKEEGARTVVVRPLPGEGDLIYSDWVRRNREYVAEKTNGKIAYIHVPDMWQEGLIEFNTWFYPQLDKEGMVVDTRWNGGGAVSQMLVERLRRPVTAFDRRRGGAVGTYPNRTLNGPFVVLTNPFAGSDGDIFPMAIQLEKLAPVIGTRSWGGVVGIYGLRPLVDGGLLTQPEGAWWDISQGWELENRGVVPDIEVENLPGDVAQGIDSQLDRGIAEVLKLHEENPPLKPEFGPVRDRSRKAYKGELSGSR